jgi:hypothetical protein
MNSEKALGAVLSLSILAACSGRGTVAVPSSSEQTNAKIVAAYGNSEAELGQTIADASVLGKTARFLTVNYLGGFSVSPASHLFSPDAKVVRTSTALMVAAYQKVYVWRLADVQLVYGDASVAVEDIPLVQQPEVDALMEQVLAKVSTASSRRLANNHRRSNPSLACPDCLLIFKSPAPSQPTTPPITVVDPWQRDRDYQRWADPSLRNQVVPTEPPIPKVAPASVNSRGLMYYQNRSMCLAWTPYASCFSGWSSWSSWSSFTTGPTGNGVASCDPNEDSYTTLGPSPVDPNFAFHVHNNGDPATNPYPPSQMDYTFPVYGGSSYATGHYEYLDEDSHTLQAADLNYPNINTPNQATFSDFRAYTAGFTNYKKADMNISDQYYSGLAYTTYFYGIGNMTCNP